jgi:hypothetical protein
MHVATDLPVLKRSVTVLRKGGQVAIRRFRDEVTLEGSAALLFGKMEPLLDGKTSFDSMGKKLGEKPERLRALAAELDRVGVLAFGSPNGDAALVSGTEFYKIHREHCSYWLQDVYAHPLWEKIVTGKATRAQVLGFAFEKYHYIEAAFEHMGIAAANATPEMMPHLARTT